MRRYMGLLVGVLLLLALAACGSRAAENAEVNETPGDPTGTVTVVTPREQEAQTPEESGGEDDWQAAGNTEKPSAQEKKPAAQTETPAAQPEKKEEQQTGETGQTASGGETLPDHWTEGGGPAPTGQKMVEATKNYDCAAAEKLGKDRLIAKGLTYNESLNRDECTVDSVHFYGSDAYFKGGQAYLNDVVLRQVERVFPTASAPDAAYTEVRCHVEYSDGSIGYITEIWSKYVGPTE